MSMRTLASIHSVSKRANALKIQHRRYSDNAGVKPYYVTTPIFYPNAGERRVLSELSRSGCSTYSTAPHIGHLHSLVVADIFARHAKLVDPGRPVRFVTGTDEHGLKLQNAAKAKGMEPLAFCDQLSEHFRVRPRTCIPIHLCLMWCTKVESHPESECNKYPVPTNN